MARGPLFKTKLQKALLEGAKAFIASMKTEDFLKIASVAGLTWLIKPVIDSTEELQVKLQRNQALLNPIAKQVYISMGKPFWETGLFNTIISPLPEADQKALEATDYTSWLFAFILACLIVQFGPDLIQSVGGVAKMGLLLLG